MTEENTGDRLWDLLVVGSGPAGLAAAINARARGKEVLVLGATGGSPRLKQAPLIRNYPGIEEIRGKELMERFLHQATALGAVLTDGVAETIYPGEEINLVTRDSLVYRGSALILATGIEQSHLLPGEKELLGRGLGYCATCDGALYKGREVAVIAETPEAVDDVNFLAGICNTVHYFPRYRGEVQVDRRVTIHQEIPRGITGDDRVTGVQLDDRVLPVAGVFIIRPVAPVERLVEGLNISGGTITVDRKMATNLTGIYAAGDCTGKPYQIAKAVGEGQIAALSAVSYLDQRSREKKAVGAAGTV